MTTSLSLSLDLQELSKPHDILQQKRQDVFNFVLISCHNKIKKHNSLFKKQECLFAPPPFIVGKPIYKYPELIAFLIKSLQHNGLLAQWLPEKKAIYISWKPDDLYKSSPSTSCYTTGKTSSNTLNDTSSNRSSGRSSSSSSGAHDIDDTQSSMISFDNNIFTSNKGKKQKTVTQPVVVVNYGSLKDTIPVNLGKK